MDTRDSTTPGGFALASLLIGLAAGAGAWAIVEFWLDGRDDNPFAAAVLLWVVTAPLGFVLLAGRDRPGAAAAMAAIAALVLFGPDFWMAGVAGNEFANLSEFPPSFWFGVRGLVLLLLLTLAKAKLQRDGRASGEHVFTQGLMMLLVFAGAALITLLALALLFAWAKLMKELDVAGFNRVFQEPWFLFPFLGAVSGLSIALMRAQDALLGALRYMLALAARILVVITAMATLVFCAVLMTRGIAPIFEKPYPGAIMLGLAITGMLIFNGLRQNGDDGPPAWPLRIAAIVTLAGFPVYAGLAFFALIMRISDYGLTPPRIAGLAVAGLVAAYAIVCLAGLVTELNWRGRRWMPLVSPLNAVMASAWMLVLVGISSPPLFNLWALSADSQYRLLASNRIDPADFDFGYLRFKLGRHGDEALDLLLALEDHPQRAAIADGVRRARTAANYWEYRYPPALGEFRTPALPDAAPGESSPQ